MKIQIHTFTNTKATLVSSLEIKTCQIVVGYDIYNENFTTKAQLGPVRHFISSHFACLGHFLQATLVALRLLN
jgi:hypothetical protein